MNSTEKYTTLAAWPLAICRALEDQNIDPGVLLHAANINREDLISYPDSRVDVRLMTDFWGLVLKATQDEAFGLKVAHYVQPMHFRALGLLMLTTDTLESALLKLGQYSSLVSNSANINIKHTPSLIGFCINPIQGVPISSMAIDSFFATLLSFTKQLGSQPNSVEKVELLRPTSKSAQIWERYFDAPIKFSAVQNCLWLKRSALQHTAVMGDEKLAAYNESVVQHYVQQLETESLTSKVKHLITAQLERGDVNITEIAEQLNLTERSLRRHLQDEDTSYRDLMQQCRMEIAEHYLVHTDLAITDIALRTGFSDTSNFSRAFTRSFNKSPSQFRNEQTS